MRRARAGPGVAGEIKHLPVGRRLRAVTRVARSHDEAAVGAFEQGQNELVIGSHWPPDNSMITFEFDLARVPLAQLTDGDASVVFGDTPEAGRG